MFTYPSVYLSIYLTGILDPSVKKMIAISMHIQSLARCSLANEGNPFEPCKTIHSAQKCLQFNPSVHECKCMCMYI